MDTKLRGKCEQYAKRAARRDPTLRVTKGWYHDPVWGTEQHWWTVRADGSIFDPTASQFPVGGVAEFYEEYDGFYPCEECGKPTHEDELVELRCCSHKCFMRMVGLL